MTPKARRKGSWGRSEGPSQRELMSGGQRGARTRGCCPLSRRSWGCQEGGAVPASCGQTATLGAAGVGDAGLESREGPATAAPYPPRALGPKNQRKGVPGHPTAILLRCQRLTTARRDLPPAAATASRETTALSATVFSTVTCATWRPTVQNSRSSRISVVGYVPPALPGRLALKLSYGSGISNPFSSHLAAERPNVLRL